MVEVDRVSKLYRGDGRTHLAYALFGRLLGATRPYKETWALREVSFSLMRGESLGVVGNNGAGKTTLLKIVAGIATPTSGTVRVRGAIAQQLAAGAGHHPYLTGRENVFLQGSVLGMTNAQIRTILERVVGFAGLDGAIDRPLWTYSSGMVARLGFAVAAHADFDLLLLDEALGSGDRGFREICMSALQEIRSSGASMIIVSHGSEDLLALCDRVMWLEDGMIRALGPAAETFNQYHHALSDNGEKAKPRAAQSS
jgi:ABC-type polysaccharide/polyol phosphate transport system ATPase subunit